MVGRRSRISSYASHLSRVPTRVGARRDSLFLVVNIGSYLFVLSSSICTTFRFNILNLKVVQDNYQQITTNMHINPSRKYENKCSMKVTEPGEDGLQPSSTCTCYIGIR